MLNVRSRGAVPQIGLGGVFRRVGTGTSTLSDHPKTRLTALSILLLITMGVAGCAPDRTTPDTEGTPTSAAPSPVGSLAPPSSEESDVVPDETIDKAAQWLVDTWESDPVSFGDIETLSDTVIALSAANSDPDTITTMLKQLQSKGQGLLEEEVPRPEELAKIIIAADVANQNPRDFLGCDVDLVEELRFLVESKGGRTAIVEYGKPYLVGVALHRGGESMSTWLIEEMHSRQDGGFYAVSGNSAQDADPVTTALGISAMNDVRRNTSNTEEQEKARDGLAAAVAWAEDPANQLKDRSSGGIRWSDDIMATGMMTAALGDVLNAGTFPGAEPDIAAPVRYLRAEQLPDGGWPGSPNGDESDIAATLQSVLGVTGAGYSSADTSNVQEMTDCPTRPSAPKETLPTSSAEAAEED